MLDVILQHDVFPIMNICLNNLYAVLLNGVAFQSDCYYKIHSCIYKWYAFHINAMFPGHVVNKALFLVCLFGTCESVLCYYFLKEVG